MVGKQIVMTKEDNLARKVKMTSAEKEKLNKLLEDDPGTLSQDKNVDIDVSKINRSLSLCSSLEARLQDDRKTTLQSRVEDDQWKMAVKMTSMKTTPTEQVLGRGPGLNIYAAKLAEKLDPKNGPIVNFTTERTNQGKKIHDTTARVSGQSDQIEFTKPQQVYSSAVNQKPDDQECTGPFSQWEERDGIRDGGQLANQRKRQVFKRKEGL